MNQTFENDKQHNQLNFSNTSSNLNILSNESIQEVNLCALQLSFDQMINQPNNQDQEQLNFSSINSESVSLTGFPSNLQDNISMTITNNTLTESNDKENELRQLLTSWNLFIW